MHVIHFTKGTADPLESSGATGASILPFADGEGDTNLSCLHLEMGCKIEAPSITHAAALLVVHGRVTIESAIGARIKFFGGMGAVFGQNEPYAPESRHRRHLTCRRIPETHRAHPRHIDPATDRLREMVRRRCFDARTEELTK